MHLKLLINEPGRKPSVIRFHPQDVATAAHAFVAAEDMIGKPYVRLEVDDADLPPKPDMTTLRGLAQRATEVVIGRKVETVEKPEVDDGA